MANLQLLADFEQQYSLQTAEITARIGRLSSLEGSERVGAVQALQRSLGDVNDLLEQMELAVRELPASSPERAKYELRVSSYRSDKRQLDEELKKAVRRLQGEDRDEVVGSSSLDDVAYSIDQEDQLIANTQRLQRSSRKLQEAYRMAIETEQIGSEVLGNLSSQHETLSRTRDRLREADADLTRSNRALSLMIRRVIQNRLLLIGIAIFLLFCLLFIIYKSI